MRLGLRREDAERQSKEATSSEELEQEIERLRAELTVLLEEIDRRRHEGLVRRELPSRPALLLATIGSVARISRRNLRLPIASSRKGASRDSAICEPCSGVQLLWTPRAESDERDRVAEQPRDRRAVVDRADRFREQPRDRKHVDLVERFSGGSGIVSVTVNVSSGEASSAPDHFRTGLRARTLPRP